MYFPTPYPDEVIGSVVARACVHLGLAPKRLMRIVLGRPDGQMSFFLPSDLRRLSILTRISPEQLVIAHTVLPYVTAFMPPSQASAMRDKVLTFRSQSNSALASLVKSVTQGSKLFKVCVQCIREDVALHGESYWRRSHLLPGVYLCPVHFSPLLEVTHLGTGRAYQAFGVGTPALCGASHVIGLPQASILRELAVASVAPLAPDWTHQVDWWSDYREIALAKGYQLVSGDVAGSQLSEDLALMFLNKFLKRLGCRVGAGLHTSWPALMVRPRVGVPFSPLKHILLATFLATCQARETPPKYRKAGKKPSDSALLDTIGAERICSVWSQAKGSQKRLTVQALLTAAGIWSLFRHNRHKFPKTVALVDEFRRSEQAERQVGRRAFWRNRLGLDEQTGESSPSDAPRP